MVLAGLSLLDQRVGVLFNGFGLCELRALGFLYSLHSSSFFWFNQLYIKDPIS